PARSADRILGQRERQVPRPARREPRLRPGELLRLLGARPVVMGSPRGGGPAPSPGPPWADTTGTEGVRGRTPRSPSAAAAMRVPRATKRGAARPRRRRSGGPPPHPFRMTVDRLAEAGAGRDPQGSRDVDGGALGAAVAGTGAADGAAAGGDREAVGV